MLNIKRIRQLNTASIDNRPIIYWMSRDQRVQDNWALLYAQELMEYRVSKKGENDYGKAFRTESAFREEEAL